jgi:regulatory protein
MQERKIRLLDSQALWDYALKILGGRAYSSGELREKLRRRAEKQEDVESLMGRLKDYGYLNDQRFAETFATSRLNNEKFGKTRVMQDLRQRRVAPALAEKTVGKVYQDVNESSLIEDWIRRKYRNAARETLFQEDKELAAAYRRLLRAGFRTAEIITVLKRFAKNPELLDTIEEAPNVEE